jgi:hypothetical protein
MCARRSALLAAGQRVSLTHTSPTAFKLDGSVDVCQWRACVCVCVCVCLVTYHARAQVAWDVLRCFARAQSKQPKLSETSPGARCGMHACVRDARV